MAPKTRTSQRFAARSSLWFGACLGILLAGACVGPDLEPPGGSSVSRTAAAPGNAPKPTTTVAPSEPTARAPAQAPIGALTPVAGQMSIPGNAAAGGTLAGPAPTLGTQPAAAGAGASVDAEDAGVPDAGRDAGTIRR